MKYLAILLVLCLGCAPDDGYVEASKPPTWDAQAVAMYKKIAPCVALIQRYDEQLSFWGTTGTAFGASYKGKPVLLTARHITKAAGKFRVVYKDGVTVEVSSFKEDEVVDIAVLTVSKYPQLLPIASTGPEVGETVYTVGNPMETTRMFTMGIVEWYTETGDIVTGAALSYGSSGGPLVTEKGEVVGVAARIKPGWAQFNIFAPTSKIAKLLEGK